MATLSFWSDAIAIVGGSGIGQYGSTGFGASVAVGSYNGLSYITGAAGTQLGPQINNIQFVNAQSGTVNGASSGINLLSIPNDDSSLEIRFEHDTAVKTQNVQVRTYDRVAITNAYSGVLVKIAEVQHPGPTQLFTGSGDNLWASWDNATGILTLCASPGSGGRAANNAGTHYDKSHSNYICLSMSPNTIGSKLGQLYVSLEYL